MSLSTVYSFVLLIVSVHIAGASVCFSFPPTQPGSVPYTSANCGGAMPTTGYPIGTQCTVPSTGCASPSLSKATCLDGVSNNEGYWSQPVCTVSATPGFSTTQAATTVVTVVANTEYAALIHLDSLYTTTGLVIGFTGGLADSNLEVGIYTLQDPVGANAGPGDLIYTVSGSFLGAGGSQVSTSTGFEVVSTITDMTTGAGNLQLNFPTPINFGNDFYLSVTFSVAGLTIPMECTGGPNTKQYWTRTSSSNPFVSTNVAGSGFGCIANVAYVLSSVSGPTCSPTLLTATIGYDGSSDSYDQNEPTMPYLDHTRSGFSGGPYLDLNFTWATGVYDDVQFLPYAGAQAFGPQPTPTLGINGAPPCGTTFQLFKQSTSNCETTATVRANFLQLISQDTATTTAVCGWTLNPAPVQYQGVMYSQWTGTIQIVTYQTVALFGVVSMRIKEAYANVVVRSPIVTSNAVASPVSVTDTATFQWSVVNQNLDSDVLPYTSTTNLQTRVTAGYELTASASITSASSPTAWTFAGGSSVLMTLSSSSAPCTGTSSACTQAWSVIVENTDSAVCSLDGVVTITFTTHCNSQIQASGGCDANVDGRTFVSTVVLSSVDFCRVIGGVTSLSMSVPSVQAPSVSVAASTTFLTNAGSNSFPAVPSIFVVGSSIGVYFTISSQPQIPLTISAVSAKVYDATDRSHFSLYSDTTQNADGNGGPYYYVSMPTIPGPTASAFFNLPTGDQGSGTVYTPWLLTNSGTVSNIIISVTASVQYDNVLLGGGPTFVTFEIPMTSVPKPSSPSPKLGSLASAIRATTQSIQTGTITQETTTVSFQSAQASTSESAMSTSTIAGVAAGGAVAVIVIIIVVVVVFVKGAASASAAVAAKYASPPVAAAAVAPAAASVNVGPAPTHSIQEDFYAPRVGTPSLNIVSL